jgi:predicted phosphodiesterase
VRLAIFSDLHLGPGPSNRCTASRGELHELLDRLEANSDRVLVGGDLFDLDRPKLPGGWRAVLDGVREQFPDFMRRLEGYEWIFGNHDGQLCRLGVPEEREYLSDGMHILALHGHQWDMPLKKLPALAPTANFVAGWLHRSGLRGVASALGAAPLLIDRVLNTGAPTSPGPDRSLLGARDLIARQDLDLLACGHSHQLKLVSSPRGSGPRGLFVNTGSLCRGFIDSVIIDTDQAHVRAFRDAECVQEAYRREDRWIVEGRSPDER